MSSFQVRDDFFCFGPKVWMFVQHLGHKLHERGGRIRLQPANETMSPKAGSRRP